MQARTQPTVCLHFCNMTILLCTCVFSVPEEQTATPIPAAGLTLEVLTTTVCFNKAVKLLCRHPDVLESGIFSTTRPSWKENGTVVALDGGMYRSAKQINETQVILELVPERSHFEPSGAHNYTCFLPLVGGGALESNLIQIRPQGMHGMHYTSTYIQQSSTLTESYIVNLQHLCSDHYSVSVVHLYRNS